MFKFFNKKYRLKSQLVSSLDDITTSIAENIVYNHDANAYTIIKEDGAYFIIDSSNNVVYDNIHYYVIAKLIVKALESEDTTVIETTFTNEQKFQKKLTDMTVYRNTEKWELYESARIDAIDRLWDLKRNIKIKN